MKKNIEETQLSRLMQQQNNLLEQQNKLLELLVNDRTFRGGGIENIDRDEIRSGFLITSDRKKLWNAQIGLINEFARICKKHNLRWFVSDGTLLGAVRHGGFIPWDDDVDVMMFRPDYEKFQRIAATEIREPYFLDIWCNYALELEGVSQKFAKENNLQFISIQESPNRWEIEWPKIKIRDSRTTELYRPTVKNMNQGIWLDVFPYDPIPPFDRNEHFLHFNIARELTAVALLPERVEQAIKENSKFLIAIDELQRLIKLPLYQRGAVLDDFQAKTFFDSKCIARTVYHCFSDNPYIFETKDFEETIYVPFEKIEVPVPKGYDNVLTAEYGDWRTPKIFAPHIKTFSADISYAEYFRTIRPEK